ncbi:crotonase/enoyl-CoA hydratase family protein [Amycolatopsis thermophila]|nr:crotonase/enoyl-CoA hydratase family protein [Amycolatopsis thermophila]
MTDPATATVVPTAGGDAVRVELHGHVLLVTINRPDARNAVNTQVTLGIGEALDYAEDQTDVWVVIVTGAGEKAFCAGQDLKQAAAGVHLDDPRVERWGFAGFVRHAISKPVIAAVNGFALGGGTEIVLASDLAVAVDTASFGLPEVKRGIYAGAGGAFRLGRQIPVKIAMEAILTGEPISAQRASELGLVNRVVPAGELLDAAFELAGRVMANAPVAVQASKRIARGITNGAVVAEQPDWERSQVEGKNVITSADAQEGMRAFAEKRVPRWQGK